MRDRVLRGQAFTIEGAYNVLEDPGAQAKLFATDADAGKPLVDVALLLSKKAMLGSIVGGAENASHGACSCLHALAPCREPC
eukprot:859228-Rhodomonas_salina.2